MAAEIVVASPAEAKEEETPKLSALSLSTYLGLSFSVFLALLPRSSISLISSLQSRNRFLSLKLIQAEEQLRQMKSRRKEDSKANARVVEIFASHRNGWQQEERKLLQQIEASAEEIGHLRVKIDELERSEQDLRVCMEKLQREVDEREEMINFMSRQTVEEEEEDDDDDGEEEFGAGSVGRVEDEKEMEFRGRLYGSQIRRGYGRSFEEEEENGEYSSDYCANFSRFGKIRASEGLDPVQEECFVDRNGDENEMGVLYGQQNGFIRGFVSAASKVSSERVACGWQDMRYDSPESLYRLKNFLPRRESPWKVDNESTGSPAKWKLLEQELLNYEKFSKGDQSKISSLIRKQAKRYQALAAKIDDLCSRMQINDPCEQNLNANFRTQRQREFLLEAGNLQQRVIEARQKLTSLQTETTRAHFGEDLETQTKQSIRKSMDSIKNNFKEMQRNKEILLARIMGDLEGLLSREGAAASRAKEYYMSKYPPFA